MGVCVHKGIWLWQILSRPFISSSTQLASLFAGFSSLAHTYILDSLLPLQFSLHVICCLFWLSCLPLKRSSKSHLLWGLFSIFPLHSILCMLRFTIMALLRLLFKDQVKLTNRWYLTDGGCSVVCDVKPIACLCFLAFAFFHLSYWFFHYLWPSLLCFLLDFSSSSLVNRFCFSLSQLLRNPTFCSLTTPCSGSLRDAHGVTDTEHRQ